MVCKRENFSSLNWGTTRKVHCNVPYESEIYMLSSYTDVGFRLKCECIILIVLFEKKLSQTVKLVDIVLLQ